MAAEETKKGDSEDEDEDIIVCMCIQKSSKILHRFYHAQDCKVLSLFQDFLVRRTTPTHDRITPVVALSEEEQQEMLSMNAFARIRGAIEAWVRIFFGMPSCTRKGVFQKLMRDLKTQFDCIQGIFGVRKAHVARVIETFTNFVCDYVQETWIARACYQRLLNELCTYVTMFDSLTPLLKNLAAKGLQIDTRKAIQLSIRSMNVNILHTLIPYIKQTSAHRWINCIYEMLMNEWRQYSDDDIKKGDAEIVPFITVLLHGSAPRRYYRSTLRTIRERRFLSMYDTLRIRDTIALSRVWHPSRHLWFPFSVRATIRTMVILAKSRSERTEKHIVLKHTSACFGELPEELQQYIYALLCTMPYCLSGAMYTCVSTHPEYSSSRKDCVYTIPNR